MASKGAQCCLGVFKIILYLTFGLAIPIACIVMAAKYDDQCPVQPYVNIYLYVAGAFCMVRGVLGIIVQVSILCGCCDDGSSLCLPLVLDIIIGVFLFCWFIAGSVWVYKLKDNFNGSDPDDPKYCNEKLYNFAFAILTTQWVLNAVSMVLSALGSCCRND